MDESLKSRVEMFLHANFPQIAMHGGSFEVTEADSETGKVAVILTDACDGCGISPMTIEALKQRMPEKVTGVTRVDAQTGSVEEKVSPSDGPF